jgi:hypothetical protein
MAEIKGVKWSIEADYLQACNCDYGCPCEFEAPPTYGTCEGLGAWRINRGKYGDLALDGLCFGFAAKWPKALHLGNGTACLFFDVRADAKQREALMMIASGQAGGIPFEILVTTLSKVLEPQYVQFDFVMNGKNSRVKMGDGVVASMEPIRNPVTGQPEGIRVEHETGFVFKGADCVSAKEMRVAVGELNYAYPGKCGFVTNVKYGN